MTQEQRSAIAKAPAEKRWKNEKVETEKPAKEPAKRGKWKMIMIAPEMYFTPEMYFGEFDYVTCWAIRRVVEFEVMLFDNRRKLPIFREGLPRCTRRSLRPRRTLKTM